MQIDSDDFQWDDLWTASGFKQSHLLQPRYANLALPAPSRAQSNATGFNANSPTLLQPSYGNLALPAPSGGQIK